MAMALDTLEYARRLRESGFSEQQAEGQARALAAAMTDALATKEDLKALEVRIVQVDARIDGLEKHIDTRLVEQEKRLEIRLDEQEKRLEIRLDEQEKRLEIRLDEQEKRLEIRFAEQGAQFSGQLADLERRVTFRLGGIMVAGIGALATLVTLF